MEDLAELAGRVLRRALETEEGKQEAARFDHVFQFQVTDGSPFYVRIRSGEVSVHPGEAGPLPYEEMEVIRGSAEMIRAMLEARERWVDLGWEGKVQMSLYGPKMHMISWLNRLVKLAHGLPLKPTM